MSNPQQELRSLQKGLIALREEQRRYQNDLTTLRQRQDTTREKLEILEGRLKRAQRTKWWTPRTLGLSVVAVLAVIGFSLRSLSDPNGGEEEAHFTRAVYVTSEVHSTPTGPHIMFPIPVDKIGKHPFKVVYEHDIVPGEMPLKQVIEGFIEVEASAWDINRALE